jgi:hypothetical protein
MASVGEEIHLQFESNAGLAFDENLGFGTWG